MHWNIDPVAFSFGPITVRWYGLLIAIAILLAWFGGERRAKKYGISEDDYLSVFMIAIAASIIGARAYYVIFNLPYYMEYPGEIIAVWHGGLAVHGGILLGTLSMYFSCKYFKIPFWTFTDSVVPFMALGQAIGRWGNFFNQEAYGYEVDPAAVPWAMWIDGAYRHPTFLYESCWDLAVFVALILLGRQIWIRRGELSLGYLAMYSMGRVIVEGFRTDSLMLGPLRVAQVMSILLIIGAVLVIVYRRKTGMAGLVREEIWQKTE